MKLFISATSPFARKVRVLIREKNATDLFEEVTSLPLENDEALHAANPLGRIPALVLENGDTLFDSVLLLDYLDRSLDGPTLVPIEPGARLAALKIQALADGILEAAVRTSFENNRPDAEKSALWLSRWTRAIEQTIDVLEKSVSGWDQTLDVGKIATGSALGYLSFRLPQLHWEERAPKLAGWWQQIQTRPSFAQTAPR